MSASPRVRSRFFWKLYAGYLTSILVSLLAAGWIVDRAVERATREDLEEALSSKATLLEELARDRLARSDDSGFSTRVRELGRSTATRLTVIASDGTVLADSEEDPERMENHLQRPEIQASLAAGSGTAERVSHTTGLDTRYFARAVQRDGKVAGFVRTALDVTLIDQRLEHVRGQIAIAAALAALVGFALAWPLAQRTIGPVRSLTAAAQSIARGDHSTPMPRDGRDELGELSSAFAAMSTELEQRMSALAADRNKVLAILTGMVEGVVAVDREDRVVHMNEAAARILRTDATAALGRRIWEATRVLDVPQILEDARSIGGERRSEVRLAEANSDIFVELFASPLSGANGEIVGAVVVLHDVTELRRLEAVRRDFVANVSHELKTPLTAIRGFVETLLDDDRMPSETRQRFLGRIRDQSTRLAALVQDLLTLARIEAQETKPALDELDLVAAVRECTERYAPIAEQKRLELASDLTSETLRVHAEAEGLRQIVGNLLDNALKYTQSGGSVRVVLRREEDDALLEVIDSGIGIEPRDQEHIFERFYRADKARSRDFGGTGLGLSIVKHLVLSYAGRVGVESRLGHGSTFSVRLPLAPVRALP